MAKFQKRVDLWTLTDEQRARLQPGQHVTAGPDTIGRFWGMGRGGTTIAAWRDNANSSHGGVSGYNRIIREYAIQQG